VGDYATWKIIRHRFVSNTSLAVFTKATQAWTRGHCRVREDGGQQ
jgi:hypothetical protein